MRMMDCVELIAEKPKYAKEGVHKGMQGVIWEEECKDGCWLVLFPQYGEKEDIADICIQEEDLIQISIMDAKVNEKIKEQFDSLNQKTATVSDEDNSCYLI